MKFQDGDPRWKFKMEIQEGVLRHRSDPRWSSKIQIQDGVPTRISKMEVQYGDSRWISKTGIRLKMEIKYGIPRWRSKIVIIRWKSEMEIPDGDRFQDEDQMKCISVKWKSEEALSSVSFLKIHTFGGPKVLQWGGLIQEDLEHSKNNILKC
jgi:hypothetical protein